MKKMLTGTLTALLCAALLMSAGAADTLSLSGTVTAGESVPVYAPIGGTVAETRAEEGGTVGADDVLFTMRTTKVYAEEDGTVTGVFGQTGDSAETVSERYGAVMYLEGSCVYSVSASTNNAYSSAETKLVHSGETVYLLCRSNNERSGSGVITSVSGNSYTVRVDSGAFIPGDSVDIYRDEAHTSTLRVGRGNVERTGPTAITASGAIVRIAVRDGDTVRRGDLLLETLDGSFDGLRMTGTEITAGRDGVIGSLNVSAGESVQKDSVAAVIYPLDSMRVEAYVTEDSRSLIHEGDPVTIELEADENRTYQGTVVLVSAVAAQDSEEVSYRVLADFTPDDAVCFGMSAVITTGDDAEPAAEAETSDAGAEETEGAAESGKHERPEGFPGFADGERPEGFPDFADGERPEGFPERPTDSTDADTAAQDDGAAAP